MRRSRQRLGKHQCGHLLIEPDRRPEMPPIGLRIRRLAAGQQHLRRRPVRPEQGPDGIDRTSDGAVGDLIRTFHPGLIDGVAENGRVAGHVERRDDDPVLHAEMGHQTAQRIPEGLRVQHQAADQPQRQDRRPSAGQETEMPAPGTRHAQCAQPAQSPVRDDAGAIVEQTRVEPRRPDDRIGIEAERAQGRGDLLGHTELDVPGRQRARRCCQ